MAISLNDLLAGGYDPTQNPPQMTIPTSLYGGPLPQTPDMTTPPADGSSTNIPSQPGLGATSGINLPGVGGNSAFGGPLGSIFGGSPFGGSNPSLNQLLQAIIPVGASLWQYLGSQGAYNQAGNLINSAEQNAASGVSGATGNANNLLQQLLGGATNATSPYTSAGAGAAGLLSSGLQPGGALNSNLTADQVLQNDPGYQFRLGQGEGDLQARLAAEGLSGSGAAQKQLIDYQQNFASNEFQNAFARQQQQQQNLFSRLMGGANLGLAGTGQALQAGEAFGTPQAANTIGSSVYGGNAGVTGAGALAGAQIDANAQKNQMIQNIMTALLGLFRNQQPAAAPAPTSTSNPLLGLLSGLGV